MRIINHINQWIHAQTARDPNRSLGFVPTMGNLHQGHLSLIKKAQEENDDVIVSVFVNATQFNSPDDFKQYPRTLEADVALLTNAGVSYCLCPTHEMMYPDGYHYQIHENNLSLMMEGEHRPGHFNGVLTVVMKLFNLVKPTSAYFGEKDYQQLELIRKMVDAFFMPIKIVACPTIRETSGLAFSSRNNRLSKAGRKTADHFASIFHSAASAESAIELLANHPIEIAYIKDNNERRYAAVIIDGIRLIDNYCI